MAVAQDLGTDRGFGQIVIVENKTGANGNIATEEVARAPADGYTLIVNTLSHNVNLLLNPRGVSDLVQQKRIRVLAVTTAKPHSDYPGVPTMAESGFPGFED